MRIFLATILALSLLAAPRMAYAELSPFDSDNYAGHERLLEWVYGYRAKPDVANVPKSVQAMQRFGLFRDTEKADFFVGFIAGVLNQNPKKADRLIKGMFPMPPKEQAVIVKAIAWSGLSNWPTLMRKYAPRMPHRQALIDQYLSGEEPALMRVPLESGPSVLYALWGFYVATGRYEPVERLIPALTWARGAQEEEGYLMRQWNAAFDWSDGKDDFSKATIGGTAKWTLVSHAERDRELIDYYRIQLHNHDERIQQKLREVIAAAEAFESERVRKEEMAAIEQIRRRNPDGANFSRATTLGSVAIATGCVAATAAGQAAIAVPCIVTGAVYSGFVRLIKGAD